ncbi:uncharacterized protein LOC142342944 [Convolutriloba macropyga]|uniref:uncharacterized protein LOC142342944 n=1 Tax=Convolutriloba macropyga TaxID=536237 RepID=UPI003F520FD9
MCYVLKHISYHRSSKSMGAESFLQLESPNDESNQRSLVPFVAETISGDTPTEKKCGLECKRRGWCKSYNHNTHLATCELLMTDYRLLEIPRVSEFESFGWRHYSKVDFVRGCVGESARDCVQLWVDTTKTSNVSITCQWTLADGEDTSFLAEQENRAHIFQHLKSHCF